MASISISFSSNAKGKEREAVKRIKREVHNRLINRVDYGSGDQSVHSGESQAPWIEAYIDNAKGPFPPDLVKELLGAMVEARGEERLELLLRLSGTGPKYRLPDEAAEAEAAFRSFQWHDETDGS